MIKKASLNTESSERSEVGDLTHWTTHNSVLYSRPVAVHLKPVVLQESNTSQPLL